jgi:hypothetical protein
MRPALAALTALASLAACTHTPGPAASSFASCPAYAPAYEITDRFMQTFNARDMSGWEATYHFPHVRVASGSVTILPSAGTRTDTFDRLAAIGWDRSAWISRDVVQCGPEKAHLATVFARYRDDGSELARFDSLYIIEFKNERWGITGRSSFAP